MPPDGSAPCKYSPCQSLLAEPFLEFRRSGRNHPYDPEHILQSCQNFFIINKLLCPHRTGMYSAIMVIFPAASQRSQTISIAQDTIILWKSQTFEQEYPPPVEIYPYIIYSRILL